MSAEPESDRTSEKSLDKASISEAPATGIQTYDDEFIRKTWRKVDLRIMTISCMLYLASYIDRYVYI